ncbi:hypothetical protein [Pseudomonas inefficax]|uniref:hypothetical protein n=1 Tax=Pseudomonas inefficax TaxID=2078786 RepID=UPI004046DAF5
MAIENVAMTLDHVSEIVIKTDPDLVAIGGIVVTAVIVVIGAWTTIKNFRIATKSQELTAKKHLEHLRDQGKSEAIARNRQEWINNLRLAVASFVSSCFELYLTDMMKVSAEGRQKLVGLEDAAAAQAVFDLTIKRTAAKCDAVRWMSQIELHINPLEADSREMIDLAKELLLFADTLDGRDIYLMTQKLIDKSQVILKKEWVRVKAMA